MFKKKKLVSMNIVFTMCNKTFSKQSNLVCHIARIYSPESYKPKPLTSHSFICDSYHQIFSRKQNLKRYLLVHASNVNCCKIVCLYFISKGTNKKFVTHTLLIEQ